MNNCIVYGHGSAIKLKPHFQLSSKNGQLLIFHPRLHSGKRGWKGLGVRQRFPSHCSFQWYQVLQLGPLLLPASRQLSCPYPTTSAGISHYCAVRGWFSLISLLRGKEGWVWHSRTWELLISLWLGKFSLFTLRSVLICPRACESPMSPLSPQGSCY